MWKTVQFQGTTTKAAFQHTNLYYTQLIFFSLRNQIINSSIPMPLPKATALFPANSVAGKISLVFLKGWM